MDTHTYMRICLVRHRRRLSLCTPPPACLTSPHLEADPVIEAASAKQTNRFLGGVFWALWLAFGWPGARPTEASLLIFSPPRTAVFDSNQPTLHPPCVGTGSCNSRICKDASAASDCVIRKGATWWNRCVFVTYSSKESDAKLATRPFTRQRGRPKPLVLCHLPQRASWRPRATRGT